MLVVQVLLIGGIGGFLLFRAPLEFALPLVVLLASVMIFSGLRSQQTWQHSFSTFRIQIDTQGIGKVQEGLPEVYIRWDEIARVLERKGDGLTVFGPKSLDILGIPATLADYAEVRARVALAQEIQLQHSFAGLLATLKLPVSLVLLFAVAAGAFADSDPWIKLACCLALLAILLKFARMAWTEPARVYNSRMVRWVSLFALLPVLGNAAVAILALLRGE